MADRGNRNPDDVSEDMPPGSAEERIRGVADESDDDFDDADDLDEEEEEDEEGTV